MAEEEEYRGRHFKRIGPSGEARAGALEGCGLPQDGGLGDGMSAEGGGAAPPVARTGTAPAAGSSAPAGETAMFVALAEQLDNPAPNSAPTSYVGGLSADDTMAFLAVHASVRQEAAGDASDGRADPSAGAVPVRRTPSHFVRDTGRGQGAGRHGGRSAGDGAPGASAEGDAPSAGTDGEVSRSVGRSAALISACVAISRITGFIRTWAMGFAMGTTLLSSSYQVACNLPNQLYELVMGGMLVTAFLPVYVSLRKREGSERANAYASTLMGIVLVLLGVVALLAAVFAPQVVWTQMFLNPSGDRELVTYFFRFFAVQLLFYGVSAVAGGLLNARRDYFWSSAAPIANNLVVIAVMFVYVFVGPVDPELGKLFIAVGTPLGVFVQMAMQIPALAKNGIHIKPWRIDLHDPALRETLALGVPTIVVTLASFATVSVQNAAAMAVSEAGSSVLFYARQWFTLPYAFLSVPLTTTLFTELSDMAADGNRAGVRDGIVSCTKQNLLFMVPFALFLAVYSVPLVTLFCAGSFTEESVLLVAQYLSYMAISLPFYALFMFMQKVFSALRRMKAYAAVNLVVSIVQVALTFALCLGLGDAWGGLGLPGVALAQVAFFVLGDVWCYLYLRRELGSLAGASLLRSALASLALGLVGAAAGGALLWALSTFVAPFEGSIPLALCYVVVCGLVSLAATYGLALALKAPGSAFIAGLVRRRSR